MVLVTHKLFGHELGEEGNLYYWEPECSPVFINERQAWNRIQSLIYKRTLWPRVDLLGIWRIN